MFLGLDAVDLDLAEEFAGAGVMPTLAALLEQGASVETLAPVGFFVGANWPTIYTGTTASRHGFTCAGEIRGGSYEPRYSGPIDDPPPVWQRLSDEGCRVVSLDAPHARIADQLNGVQLVEWGCHDRHAGTRSYPAERLEDINARYGAHPIGTVPHAEREHYAPCDFVHRAGDQRTAAENAALLDTMQQGVLAKRALSLDLLDEEDWDLFFAVFGEGHCTGHQFWHVHDEDHPWHDPTVRAHIGEDPLRRVYAMLDQTIGNHLERLDAECAAYVLLSHGMRAHYDGTQLLDPILWRLDQNASGYRHRGWLSRAADVGMRNVPAAARATTFSAAANVRRRLAARVPLGYFDEDIPWLGVRRWWAAPNDTVCGSVRLNLEQREPNGRITNDRYRATLGWLADRLAELVNVETGEAAVADVVFTDEQYERTPSDAFGDLIVEWNRAAPIETVWSPAVGVVRVPYEQWRTGDHHRRGLFLARGPGIAPGRRAGCMPVLDIAPTLAASLGFDFNDFDGTPRSDLVPAAVRPPAPFAGQSRRELSDRLAPKPRASRRWARRNDVGPNVCSDRLTIGLAGAHHVTAAGLHETRGEVDALRRRLEEVERAASVATVTAWLRQVDVPEHLLVSVITPTRNRRDLLPRAIESVRAQSYGRWEMLVVDDGSDDGTGGLLDDLCNIEPRLVALRFDHARGASAARNLALEKASGEIVVYLDDDNRFDPEWLRAAVWAFTEYPETNVGYGARVVDNVHRHNQTGVGGLPAMEFLAWDRATFARQNLIDQNVFVHRRGYTNARFDERLTHYSDWDFLLQLTDEEDPREIPVVAACFMTDASERLSDTWGAPEVVAQYEYVCEKTARRRGDA